MEDFNRIGKELDGILRTRTTPLGIKYFEDESDVPEAFEKIEQQITICQLIGTARYEYNERDVHKIIKFYTVTTMERASETECDIVKGPEGVGD